jgi:O-antigen/teichoic acid export membrane protein
MAVVMHANKILFQFGRVLIPAASSLQAADDDRALARLVVQGTRCSILIALPMVLVLTLLGQPLMHVWMGDDYGHLPLLGILAVGHLAALSQTGAFYALQGMDRHGIPGLATLAATVLSISASWIALWGMDAGLISVSISIGASLTIVNVLVIPIVVARAARMSVRTYVLETVPNAVAAVLPFGLWLVICRYLLGFGDLATLGLGLGGGGVLLGLAYWRAIIPPELKARLIARIRPAAAGRVTS